MTEKLVFGEDQIHLHIFQGILTKRFQPSWLYFAQISGDLCGQRLQQQPDEAGFV